MLTDWDAYPGLVGSCAAETHAATPYCPSLQRPAPGDADRTMLYQHQSCDIQCGTRLVLQVSDMHCYHARQGAQTALGAIPSEASAAPGVG